MPQKCVRVLRSDFLQKPAVELNCAINLLRGRAQFQNMTYHCISVSAALAPKGIFKFLVFEQFKGVTYRSTHRHGRCNWH